MMYQRISHDDHKMRSIRRVRVRRDRRHYVVCAATFGLAAGVVAFRNCGATVWESHPVAATRPPTFNFAQGMVPRA